MSGKIVNFEKEERSIMEFVDERSKIVITVWLDSKPVLMLSKYIGKEPINQCSRYDWAQKRKVNAQRQDAVTIYSTTNLWVVLTNANVFSTLSHKAQSAKMVSVNNWIIYQSIGGQNPIVKYLVSLATSLISGKPPNSSSDADTKSEEEKESEKSTSRKANEALHHQSYKRFNH